MKAACLIAISCLTATQLVAAPLVTSSEETHARACLAREAEPTRLIAMCDTALTQARLTQSQRVELQIARGDAQLWSDAYDQAEASYRAALEIDPTAVEAWNGLGWVLWDTSGYNEAFEAFSTSVSIGVSVQGLSGQAASGRGLGAISGHEARQMLEAALAIDPDYTWARREIGWSFLDEGRADEAEIAFRLAIEADAYDFNARYGIGRAQLSAGNAEAALNTFNDILAEGTNDFGSRVYRVIALRTLDRNAQALREADRLITDFPDSTSGYVERGKALLGLQRREEAIENFKTADMALGPNNVILYWYADALAADFRFEESLKVINRGILLDGADFSDHLLKSYIALELEDYSLSRAEAEKSIELGGDDPWAHYYIAISLVHQDDVSGGLEHFERAVETGLPSDQVGPFASELVGAGKYVEAAQLRLKY